ncbi:type II secretion system protein J [Evansella sp. AB-rgal1]|uniref:PulJ/GspJ family protein n=1 Tax=Evansella sp. AB-rgal1 TaxID=3242696 RepID=UPI00359CF616
MYKNEKGITLIEVLISVAILSFIGIVIWNVFIQGLTFSEQAMRKNQMQQEANIIVTSLVRSHQAAVEVYEINDFECKIMIDTNSQSNVIEHPQLCLSTNYSDGLSVNPNIHDITITINVADKNNPNNKVSIDTILTRLKSGEE